MAAPNIKVSRFLSPKLHSHEDEREEESLEEEREEVSLGGKREEEEEVSLHLSTFS